MPSPSMNVVAFRNKKRVVWRKEERKKERFRTEAAEFGQILQLLQLPQLRSSRKIGLKGNGKDILISYCLLMSDAAREVVVTLGAQAKLRLFQAVGWCKTFRTMTVYLSGIELEALLKHLGSKPRLRSLHISAPRAAQSTTAAQINEDATSERICKILGGILRRSKLTSLRLYLWNLTAKGVEHLASGVSGLKKLCLHQGRNSSLVGKVSELVRAVRELQELELLEVGVPHDDDINALAMALLQSRNLCSLRLNSLERGVSALFGKVFGSESAFDREDSARVRNLKLDGVVLERLGDFVLSLLSWNRDRDHALEELVCEPVEGSLSPDEWRKLGELLSNEYITFRIRLPWSCIRTRGEAIDSIAALLSSVDTTKVFVGLYLNSSPGYSEFSQESPWFRSSEWMAYEAEELLWGSKSICELHLDLDYRREPMANLGKALSKITLLSSLYLQMTPQLLWKHLRKVEIARFLVALRRTSSLRLLTVDGGNYNQNIWPGGWKKLIDCLRSNTSITHLRFINCKDFPTEELNQYNEALKMNFTFKTIRLNDTSWERDGKQASTEEVSRQASKRESYFNVLKRLGDGFQFDPTKQGRLFLCGSSLAGKTALRHTMTRIGRGTGCWQLGDKAAGLLIHHDRAMQISVWDEPGKWLFWTPRDILFSRTNPISVFIFNFDPTGRCDEEDLKQCFITELEELLRFVVSFSPFIGWKLPKVLVVISHADKLKRKGVDVSWASSTVEDLGAREEYQNILNLQIQKVDSRQNGEVSSLRDFILQNFRESLADNSFMVPKVCEQISFLLAKRTKDVRLRPVWPLDEFYDQFCFKSLPDNLKKSLTEPQKSEAFQAMTSHLHDTGSIINISSLKVIIVDPYWLTNIFLAELILISQEKWDAVSPESESKTGFVSSSELQFFLQYFVVEHPEFRDLNARLLKEILIRVDLCYQLEGQVHLECTTQYYIPAMDSWSQFQRD